MNVSGECVSLTILFFVREDDLMVVEEFMLRDTTRLM